MAKQMSCDKKASPSILSSSGELRGQSRHNLNSLLFANNGGSGGHGGCRPTWPASALLLWLPVLSSWELLLFEMSVPNYDSSGPDTTYPEVSAALGEGRAGRGDRPATRGPLLLLAPNQTSL